MRVRLVNIVLDGRSRLPSNINNLSLVSLRFISKRTGARFGNRLRCRLITSLLHYLEVGLPRKRVCDKRAEESFLCSALKRE